MPSNYPSWKHYPARTRPPGWVEPLISAFAATAGTIDSRQKLGMNSNAVLAQLRPALLGLGFDVEAGKKNSEKLRRPVLFGEQGVEDLAYEVDAFQTEEGIALEIEAGRGVLGNAVYRDLIQTSLLIDATYLVLAVMIEYH